MEIKNAALGDVPMLVIAGEVDDDSCATLRAELERWIESGQHVIFLDVSTTARIAPQCMTMLGTLVRTLRWGWLGVIGADDEIGRALQAEGLAPGTNLRMFQTREAARVVTGERAST